MGEGLNPSWARPGCLRPLLVAWELGYMVQLVRQLLPPLTLSPDDGCYLPSLLLGGSFMAPL